MNDKKKKFRWQQNLLKIPGYIRGRVRGLSRDELVVACVKKILPKSIEDGVYTHLDLRMEAGSPVFPAEVLPKPDTGRFSKANVHGKELVLKERPMVTQTVSVLTPNFGDWSRGSHYVHLDREVYQRKFLPPKELVIKVERIGDDATTGALLVKFTVDQVLDRRKASFDDELLYTLNLLQENVGKVDVFPSDATLADFLKTVYVDWEILPPGERDKDIVRILSGFGPATPEVRQKLSERYDLLASLYPQAFITGSSGFRRYFGAKFADDLVVFENLQHGNAVYVMFERWEDLSRKSRLELLAGDREGFERVVHRAGWKQKLKSIVRDRTKKRPPPK